MDKINFILVAIFFSFLVSAQSIQEHKAKAIEYYNLGNYEAVVNEFSAIITLNPKDSSAYFDRGMTKELLEDYLGALNDFSQQIEIDKGNVDNYYLRGMMKFKLKDYAGAISDFITVNGMEQGNADAFYFKGISYLFLGKNKESKEAFDYAINGFPRHARAFAFRGLARALLGEKQSAIIDCNRAIELDSNAVDFYYCRGFVHAKHKNTKDAAADFKKAVDLNYSEDVIFCELKLTIPNAKKVDAETNYMSFNNQKDSATFKLGILHELLGNYKIAINLFSQTIEQNSNFYMAFYELGNTYLKLKNKSLAIVEYKKAISLNPNFEFGHKNLVNLEINSQMWLDAKLHCIKLIELNKHKSDYYLSAAQVYQKLGDSKLACDYFNLYTNHGGGYGQKNKYHYCK